MFTYAACYFSNPDAQFNLARLYLDGVGLPRDTRQAVRWLGLAANKGQARAPALLRQRAVQGRSRSAPGPRSA